MPKKVLYYDDKKVFKLSGWKKKTFEKLLESESPKMDSSKFLRKKIDEYLISKGVKGV